MPSWVCVKRSADAAEGKVEHEQACDRAFRSDLSTRSQWVTRCWLRQQWKANKSSNGKSPPMPKRYGESTMQ